MSIYYIKNTCFVKQKFKFCHLNDVINVVIYMNRNIAYSDIIKECLAHKLIKKRFFRRLKKNGRERNKLQKTL